MMIIKRKSLLDALEVAGRANERSIFGTRFVIFDKKCLRSLDYRISIAVELETGIEGALPMLELIKALKVMKGDDVAITTEGDQVMFKCGYSELALKLIAPGALLNSDTEELVKRLDALNLELDQVNWAPAPARVLEGLKLSLLAAEDSEIGRLSGIVISDGQILATDNYRVSRYDLVDKIGENVRLQTSSVKIFLKIKRSFDLVGISEEWFHLKSTKDNLIVSLRQMPIEDYPIDEVLSVFNEDSTEIYELPDNLEQFIDRAEVFAGIGRDELNFGKQISLWSEDGNLVITGTNSIGKFSNKIPWDGYIPQIIIVPDTLKKVIKLTRSFKIESPDRNMIVFEIPGFKFLVVAKVEQAQKQPQKPEQTNICEILQQKIQALKQLMAKKEVN